MSWGYSSCAGRTTGRLGLALLVGLVWSLSGCTGGSSSRAPASPPSSGGPTAAPVTVRVTRVAGTLGGPGQRAVADRARRLVTTYARTAFAQDPPSGATAFPGFTPRARHLAVHDRALLTSAGFASADAVTLRKVRAWVAVLAPHRRPAGATARLEVDLGVTHGDAERLVQRTGRLLLTPTAHGWRIFGYDMAGGRR